MPMTTDSPGNDRASSYGRILQDALYPHAEVRKIEPRRNLYLKIDNSMYCYLILEGYFGVYRKSDNRMLAILSSPSIIGLSGMARESAPVYLKALVPSVAGKVPLESVQNALDEQGLWETLARYLMQLSERLFISGEQLTPPAALEMIRIQLKELMNEDESIRTSITAERYIRDKTELSRSRIMAILSALKKSGDIDLKKGILLNINNLP